MTEAEHKFEFASSLTEEQRDFRSRGIGGSDVGAIIGVSPWKTGVDLWAEKTGLVEPQPLKNAEAAHFGVVLEHVVAEEFTRRTGIKLRRQRATITSKKHSFMLANIDRRVVGARAGFEAKINTAWGVDQWGETGTDDFPLNYIGQCMHYMEVMEWDRYYLAVLIGGNEFRWYVIERNPKLAAALIEKEQLFWQHVVSKQPPDPRVFGDVLTLYPRDKGGQIVATEAIFRQLGEYSDVQSKIAALAARQNALKLEIGGFMKDKQRLIDRTGAKLATFASHTRVDLDVAKLKEERPDVYDEFASESDVRPFKLCL